MQVADVLRKKTARVVTIRMNETIDIAARRIRALAGVISMRDIAAAVDELTEREPRAA